MTNDTQRLIMANEEYGSYSEISAAEIERILQRAHQLRSEYLARGLLRALRRVRLRRTRQFKLAPESR